MAPDKTTNAAGEMVEHFSPDHVPEAKPKQDFESTPNTLRTDKTLVVKSVFEANDQETRMLRGQTFGRKAVSGNYTCAVIDYLLGVTSLAVAPNIGLPKPTLAGAGKVFIIKDEAGGAGTTNVTIRSDGEKLIDGSASTTLSANYQAKEFYTDGANWFTK